MTCLLSFIIVQVVSTVTTLDIYHIPSRTSVQPCDPASLCDADRESPSADKCPIYSDSWEEILYPGSVHDSHG
jgi:hypothetical protein